jgi:hypothetical protein
VVVSPHELPRQSDRRAPARERQLESEAKNALPWPECLALTSLLAAVALLATGWTHPSVLWPW